jgi:glycosyltransferase involved in cell wall biosynthesis
LSRLPESIAFFTDARAWGGAEVYLIQLAESVRAAGVTPRIFCADRREADAWAANLTKRGFAVERYRPTKEFNPLGYFVARRVLRGFELIHINKTHPRNSLPAVLAARRSGASVVVATEHLALSPESHFPMGGRIITWLVRFTNRLLDRTIAVSELSRAMLMRNYGIPPDRIVAIRNGIDVSRFDEPVDEAAVREELGIGAADRMAILVGRFAPRKGHTYALQALALTRERLPGLKLVFAGDGELEDSLRREASRLGVERDVIFAGFRRDVPRLLAASEVLLLPSEDECLPLVILEAMSARLPVISTDVGGISEAVVDGETGVLVEPRDAPGLADAMVRVLGDPARAAALGAAGRRKVETEFSLDATASAVFALYDELLRKDGRS